MPGSATISWTSVTIAANVSLTQSSNGNGLSNTSTSSLNGVAAGALLVFCTTASDGSSFVTDATVSSSPSLTWTKRVDAQDAISGSCEIWTAVFSAGGNISVTGNWGAGSGSFMSSSSIYEFSNADTSVGGATGVAIDQTTPSCNITTNRANSILVMVCCDYNVNDGTTRTYRDTPTTEVLYLRTVGSSTVYHWYKSVTTATTYTEGLTAPTMTGAGAGMCILEVRGN